MSISERFASTITAPVIVAGAAVIGLIAYPLLHG